jgi:hypothetical protein
VNKILLTILSYPIFFTPLTAIVIADRPAHAQEKDFVFEAPSSSTTENCVSSPHNTKLVCVQTNKEMNVPRERNFAADDDTPILEFSDEESDAAIALFGCDCVVCINSLRQLKGMSPMNMS